MRHASARTGGKRGAGRLASALAASALALAACGSGGGAPADGPIRIGVSLPLTGAFSPPGKAAEQGYRVWENTVNNSGGLLGRDVELVIRDDASTQNTVVADYNALISQDRVDLLLGTFSSLLNLPASAVAERHKMLYVEPAGGSPDIFERRFRYLFFSQQTTSDHQGDTFAEWISSLPEGERPRTAAFPMSDDPFSTSTALGIKRILEAAGIATVYEERIALDTRNLDTVANGLKAADPDIVVHGAGFEDGVGLVRAMLKADFRPGWLYQTSAPSMGEQYAQAIGPENTEGVVYSISHTPHASTPGNAEFVQAFHAQYGAPPAEDAADAYAAAQVLQAAVEAVGSVENQEALADWLRANTVSTILGPISWDDAGRPSGDYMVGQWQNGSVEIIVPTTAATTDTIVRGWQPGSRP